MLPQGLLMTILIRQVGKLITQCFGKVPKDICNGLYDEFHTECQEWPRMPRWFWGIFM